MITSRQNSWIKQLRHLHHPKGRQEQELFLLEGTHLVQEALTQGHGLAAVCATPDWHDRQGKLWQQLEQVTPRLELVSPEVLATVATTVHPDGVVGVAPLGQRLQPCLPVQRGLVLETLQDPGNLGTIIRTAAAAGVEGLWLSQDSVDLYHPKVLRASVGQWFRLPMETVPDLGQLLTTARDRGMAIVATSATAPCCYWDWDWRQPSLVVLGNEGAGLSERIQGWADVQVRIPVAPGVESLNVAIAAGLLLYEGQRQTRSPSP